MTMRMRMTSRIGLAAVVVAELSLASSRAWAFRDDEVKAEAAAAYRAAVTENARVGAAQADEEAARLEDLRPRLTESQRREMDRCVANGMVYVSPGVGCQRYWDSR